MIWSRLRKKATQAYALREALALYAEALAVASRLGDPADAVVAVRRARSDLLHVIGDFGACRRGLQRAARAGAGARLLASFR